MTYTCRYCGQPIDGIVYRLTTTDGDRKKFIIGWTHVNGGLPGVPTTLHTARPR
jgi:hypothetical protein